MNTQQPSLPMEPVSAAAPIRRLETFLGVFLLLAILATFWTQQRYPALLGKLHAGNGILVHGAISFDAVLPVAHGMPLAQRILRTGINWLWTNRLGMFFAIPFGAAMMTLMAQGIRPKRFVSAAGNVLCGAVAGAPLGVCTNCATPIGQSLLLSGASSRLTVAAMISSPSFNPVVVAMAFLLFPAPLALFRIAVPLVLLLLLPILVPEIQGKAQIKTLDISWERESRRGRVGEFTRQFGKNLLRVSWLTLPWMMLAALLGAVAGELIPAYGTHLHASVLSIIAVAVLGTLLPVPMALDVALAFVLYRAGAPPALVVTLLCTLGPVSVYSLGALARQLGRDSMIRLAGTTMALGTGAGLGILLLQ